MIIDMKKLFILALFSAATLCSYAQKSAIGLEVGFAQSDFRLNQPLPPNDPNTKVLGLTALNGLKVGLMWDATYIKGFGSTIGLRYTFGSTLTNWVKVKDDQIGDFPRTKDRYNYSQLELYVDWQYKFEIAANTYIILSTGPSIQCGISMQNTNYYQEFNQETQEKRISRYDYSDADLQKDYQRFNVGWGIGAGFQYDRFFIRGGYDFGLTNPYKIHNFNEIPDLIKKYGNDYSQYTRGRLDQWHIRLGFYFMQWDNK